MQETRRTRRHRDALPKSAIGNRALALSSWKRYGLGQTISQIVSVFDSLFHFPVSGGGLTQLWQRLSAIIEPWHDGLAQEARDSAVLNADETGWRVNGRTHWLWRFTNPALTCYVIDPTRSSKVPARFLADCFNGTLASDFFGAYNAIGTKRQMRLAHLLRELEKVDKTSPSKEWTTFRAILKRILKDAIRLSPFAPRRSRSARLQKQSGPHPQTPGQTGCLRHLGKARLQAASQTPDEIPRFALHVSRQPVCPF